MASQLLAGRSPLTTLNSEWTTPHSVLSCPETFIDIPTGAPDVERLLEARRAQEGTLHCRVRRTRTKNLLELSIEEGNVFVLAAVRQGKDWLISERKGGSTTSVVARLRGHKDGTFTCTCECGSLRTPPYLTGELLFVRQAVGQFAELPEINTMIVAQSLDRAKPSGTLGAHADTIADSRSAGRAQQSLSHPGVSLLESRLPKYNKRSGSYELPFAGRANHASARNFQLVQCGAKAERPVLLYGKLEEDEFALDFAHPLSMLQAFAIVLTTWGW